MAQRTKRPLAEELPRLLAAAAETDDRPRSLRALADAVGVNQSYLSRILGAKGSRPPSQAVVEQIAQAFGLPADYFPEYRAAVVVDAARRNPALLDSVYDRLQRNDVARSRTRRRS